MVPGVVVGAVARLRRTLSVKLGRGGLGAYRIEVGTGVVTEYAAARS